MATISGRTNRLRLFGAAVALAVVIAPALAVAQRSGPPRGGGRGPHGGGPWGHGDGPGPGFEAHLHEHMMLRLDLSSEQKAEVKAVMESQSETAKALSERFDTAQAEVRDLAEADLFDETAIRHAAERAAAIRIEMVVERARTGHEIRQLLTAEQQAVLDEMRQKKGDLEDRLRDRRFDRRGWTDDSSE